MLAANRRQVAVAAVNLETVDQFSSLAGIVVMNRPGSI